MAKSPDAAAGYSPSAEMEGTSESAAVEELPRKRINSQADLDTFTSSRLCEQLISFASELSQAIQGQEVSSDRLAKASPLVQGLVELLSELESWLDDFPALDQPMRFGNKAFRQWHSRLVERGEGLLLKVLRKASAQEAEPLAKELNLYLCGSFGDQTRIDYGTGHEAAFFAVLFILGARGVLAKTDAADVVLLVFSAYLRVMYRLQTAYVLEPAGSHGVWGLDDFHALPFLFGAAQLVGMEEEVPTGTVYHESIVKEYADRYIYVGAIRQVLSAKRGAPFHETSPMLYDITAVPTWQKTHNGLLKMYRAEVLGKLPVIQHFLFGPTIRWPGNDNGSAATASAKPAATPSTVRDAVSSGVACAAPWAKAPGQATRSPGFEPTAAPWAKKT